MSSFSELTLQAYEANIDYRRGIISLSDDLVRAPLQSLVKSNNAVSCIQSVCIPAETELLILLGRRLILTVKLFS